MRTQIYNEMCTCIYIDICTLTTLYSISMARSKGRTIFMNAKSTNKLSDTYHQLYKGVGYILFF